MPSRSRQLAATAASVLALLVVAEATGALGGQWARPLVIAGLGGVGADGPEDDLQAAPSVKEEFLIPLTDGDNDRYLRATVVIELYDAQDRDDLKAHVGQLRDAFIVQSVNLDPDALNGPGGLKKGRDLMELAVHQARPGLEVRGIYFADFILR
jgi:flagellar basal body-associated protein FliL